MKDSTPFNPGLLLWNEETGAFQEIDYDTFGDDPQITRDLSLWTLYQAEVFNEADISEVSAYAFSVNARRSVSVLQFPWMPTAMTRCSARRSRCRTRTIISVVAPFSTVGNLVITLTPGTALNGVVTLFDSAGEQVARANAVGNGGVETINVAITPGETYSIRVAAASYATTDTYTLSVNFPVTLPPTFSVRRNVRLLPQ